MSQENNVTLIPEENMGLVSKEANSQDVSLTELSSQSIENYDDNTQAAIRSLAAKIDVTQIDKVNSYADIPLQKGISELKGFMERMKGTEEDKQTVKAIAELSEKVNNQINDIKIVAKEMNFFEKIFEFFRGDPHDNTLKKIDSCNKLLEQLSKHMDDELAIVSARQYDADQIIKTNVDISTSLEQYIVAGYIAEERIDKEIDDLRNSSALMVSDHVELENLKTGIKTFKTNLLHLEQTRLATYLSIMETLATKACLSELESNFKSTMENLLLIFAQQSSNTLLEYTVRNAIDSHNDITKLNTAMMKSNAKNIETNYADVAKLISKGVADVQEIKQCASVIVEAAKRHNEIIDDYVNHMDEYKKEMDEALEPIKTFFDISSTTTNEEGSNNSAASTNSTSLSSGALKF